MFAVYCPYGRQGIVEKVQVSVVETVFMAIGLLLKVLFGVYVVCSWLDMRQDIREIRAELKNLKK